MDPRPAAPLTSRQLISHNLINALASVRSLTELLADYPGLPDDERKRFLDLIRHEIDRLTRLFAQLTRPSERIDPS